MEALEGSAWSASMKQTEGGFDLLWTIPPDSDEKQVRTALSVAVDILALPGSTLDSLRFEPKNNENWLEKSYEGFQPFSLGSFFIYGAHHRGAVDVPAAARSLEIDAATAFGSGEHGTTAGCLLALEALKEKGFAPESILDMGTGSGILAIAAKKFWPHSAVMAVDNDPESIAVTDRHAAQNETPMQTLASEGFAERAVHDKGPYDLVIANILAGPLIEMADDLAKACGGFLILSGLLIEQQNKIMDAYTAQGMRLVTAAHRGEWAILTLAKN